MSKIPTVVWSDSHSRPVPTRVVTATHRGLSLRVEQPAYGSLTAMVSGAVAGAHCYGFATGETFEATLAATIALADKLADAGWTAR